VAGWIPLGSCTVSADTGQWVKAAINFSPGQQIQAIALGPACDTIYVPFPDTYFYQGAQVTAQQFSYFLDKLQFFQSSVPKPIVSLLSGGPCSSSAVLQMQPAGYYTGSSLQWYKNDTALAGQQGNTLTVIKDKPGEAFYSCRVQNDTLCIVSDSFPLVWSAVPSGAVLGGPDTAACIGDTVVLNALTDSSFSYTWQNGLNSPYFSVTQSGTYTLTISNQCGTAHAIKTINFGKCDLSIAVPNAFTPNGDGLNDMFKVHYYKMPQQFSMRIFNRNGMELFFTTDPGTGWDGFFNGASQPAGSYVWYIRYRDGKDIDHELKGVLVLIR
jgi:gliding motility-associated-like protein